MFHEWSLVGGSTKVYTRRGKKSNPLKSFALYGLWPVSSFSLFSHQPFGISVWTYPGFLLVLAHSGNGLPQALKKMGNATPYDNKKWVAWYHWKWYDLIDHFLLVFFNNFVPKTHHFWDIRLPKCLDLENRVRGPSRSLDMSPFESADDFLLTFYGNYGSVSCRFWDIQCRKMSWPWNRGLRSLNVIEM